ncbi:Gfo/Idh/MocA family protein [Mariluticola halotolerans]|uniref:Gfo/Idh/MocA family protein n=1 Tax=Mariluticola halotolerans TaxID=2909283 RepID=UPI0026E2415E|nr:Gfo/Idh/MocA family oxidoreductase [Mariluticola halotolerans]UJQ94370.1 Gfo/Idh/MocA family oxidoreductase [Mariluticola halotolerans]
MRILILGTGGMARQHAEHFAKIDGVEVVAGVDVDPAKLRGFCDLHDIPNAFASLEAALVWGEFDAVANVTPDSAHYATTLMCLAAGKHVFCEKPLATDYAKALEMTEAAERAGLIGMVNLTYRNVPHVHKAREMVLGGVIGTVKHVEASYLQSWLVQPAWGHWDKEHQWLWRLSTAHGSNGVLGDVGIHILDFAVFGAATDLESVFCRLKTFHKAPGDRIDGYVLDANDSFSMSVAFENGAIGVVHASRWAAGHINELKLRIYGDKGGLEVTHRPDGSELRASVGEDVLSGVWRDLMVEPVVTNYQRFAAAVAASQAGQPSFRHAAELQKVLDLSVQSDRDHGDHAV